MNLPVRVETERLLLRWPMVADAEEVFARYAQDPEVCLYLSWTPHQSLEETVKFLQWSIDQRQSDSSFNWLIYPRAGGAVLGSIGFRVDKHKLMLGYCLARNAWGQGFATEASRAVVDLAFLELAVWRVQAFCDVENRGSARVLEKSGLVLEGTLRRHTLLPNLGEVARDVLLYARVREA